MTTNPGTHDSPAYRRLMEEERDESRALSADDTCSQESDWDYYGNDISNELTWDASKCCDGCIAISGGGQGQQGHHGGAQRAFGGCVQDPALKCAERVLALTRAFLVATLPIDHVHEVC